MVKLVTDWLLNKVGGLAKMAEINKQESQNALRRHRAIQGLLHRPCRAGLPFDDERALQTGQAGIGRTVPQGSGGARTCAN